ncbi:Deoxycytidine monophosphate (dCMP) deaminase [Coelomomyces lativittatus]|nr:Deoxycytidine monophosphate (dCMP) deaminase [Coelomomyces lativittatus]KAJ1504264.1 Deoxycytidine monophosphate (dCMP) deaminase [Coelomomyces lativittatus]
MIHADMTFINDTLDINLLYSALDKVQFADPERIRPSWDTYFMTLCEWTAHRSNCMKRKVGALLTSDHRILSTGYNGTPFRTLNCNAGGCPRCNDNARAGTHLETCFCLHAEENALLVNSDQNQGHHHHSALTLYCTMFPCIQCAKKIIQCNVVRLVYHRTYASLDTMVLEYFKKSGVHVEMYQEKKKVVKCSDFMKTDLSNGLQVY